ncbi:MAG: EamA family transporter [Chloroflexi bacterium]|nr:EamA family transporter [Chloroflexota bacterium]
MLGIVLAALSSLSFAGASVFARLGFRQVAVLKGTWLTLLAGLAFVLAVALATQFRALVTSSLSTLLWFAAVGLITLFVGRLLQYAAIKYVGVVVTTPITGSAPVFALPLAVVLASEELSLPVLAGTVLVVAGLVLVITQEKRASA